MTSSQSAGLATQAHFTRVAALCFLTGVLALAGCINEEIAPDGSDAVGALVAESASISRREDVQWMWAAFIPDAAGGQLFVFDFTNNRVLKLDGRIGSFAEGLASLGALVDASAIENPALRDAVMALPAGDASLREVQPGEWVPVFEVRDADEVASTDSEVAGARTALKRATPAPAEECPAEDGGGSVLVVANGGGGASRAGLDVLPYPNPGLGHGSPTQHAACRQDCRDQRDALEAAAQSIYNAAMAAIQAEEDACHQGCAALTGVCAGARQAACDFLCSRIADLAELAARAALAAASLYNNTIFIDACYEGCDMDYTDVLTPKPPTGCGIRFGCM